MPNKKNSNKERHKRPLELAAKVLDCCDTPEAIAKFLKKYNTMCLEFYFYNEDDCDDKEHFREGYLFIDELASALDPKYNVWRD